MLVVPIWLAIPFILLGFEIGLRFGAVPGYQWVAVFIPTLALALAHDPVQYRHTILPIGPHFAFEPFVDIEHDGADCVVLNNIKQSGADAIFHEVWILYT